jgi:hypothetical protein
MCARVAVRFLSCACIVYDRASDFVKSIAHYTEAIKRNPAEAAVYYCNRAAARTKLMDFNTALEDCNAALKQNPTYVKAFGRKGALEFLMKEYHKVRRQELPIPPSTRFPFPPPPFPWASVGCLPCGPTADSLELAWRVFHARVGRRWRRTGPAWPWTPPTRSARTDLPAPSKRSTRCVCALFPLSQPPPPSHTHPPITASWPAVLPEPV